MELLKLEKENNKLNKLNDKAENKKLNFLLVLMISSLFRTHLYHLCVLFYYIHQTAKIQLIFVHTNKILVYEIKNAICKLPHGSQSCCNAIF